MITVSILINGQPIFTRSAVRTHTGKVTRIYQLPRGRQVLPGAGADVAIKNPHRWGLSGRGSREPGDSQAV